MSVINVVSKKMRKRKNKQEKFKDIKGRIIIKDLKTPFRKQVFWLC
jgi:hypothetical protein